MTVYHGVTVDLRNERLLAEGKATYVYIGTLDGSGANQDLKVPFFPITTNAGVATDAEAEVDVYTDDGTVGTWTEYLDDGSDFTIVGATGVVTIQAAENQAGNAGERIAISYYYAETLARGQEATIDFDRDLEDVHELGNAAPQELAAGHYKVSGTIGVLYTSRDAFGLTINESDFYKRCASMSFYLYPNKDAAGQPYIKVTNATFYGGSIKSTLKGLVAVNLKFKGTAITLGTHA